MSLGNGSSEPRATGLIWMWSDSPTSGCGKIGGKLSVSARPSGKWIVPDLNARCWLRRRRRSTTGTATPIRICARLSERKRNWGRDDAMDKTCTSVLSRCFHALFPISRLSIRCRCSDIIAAQARIAYALHEFDSWIEDTVDPISLAKQQQEQVEQHAAPGIGRSYAGEPAPGCQRCQALYGAWNQLSWT